MREPSPHLIRARTDASDHLIVADEPLAGLQLRGGGVIPGPIVPPALLDMVRKVRAYGLSLARAIEAQDDESRVSIWAEVTPREDGEGCDIALSNWRELPPRAAAGMPQLDNASLLAAHCAGLALRLGREQEILAVDCFDAELADLAATMEAGRGRPWTDFVAPQGITHRQPIHWRLLDGAELEIEGATRNWGVHFVPQGRPVEGSAGFELYFVADQPAAEPAPRSAENVRAAAGLQRIGREIAPVLRQPVARIIANAETIHTQMAGPLAAEYSDYAADISSAGEHLLGLIDDLTTLDMIEDEEFAPAPDKIDLADLARRSAGILGMRARERGIRIDTPKDGEKAPAIGEFRRVLQVLLNLLGNAIRYSPEGAEVWLRVENEDGRARVIVADQGEGLTEDEQARVFDKFERLGRSGDGGSGLGLYISRRLAEAMNGSLGVESARGQGARFTLELPSDPEAGGQ